MKKLLLIFILATSFQTLVKANDIRDFEIEGISVGDSLLNFFSKKEINDNLKEVNYTSDSYLLFEIYKADHQLDQYDALMIHFKKNALAEILFF